MRTEFDLLKDLGYSVEEIESFEKSYSKGTLDYLVDNMENVCANMRYLLSDVDKKQLLKYSIWYIESFSMNPAVFSKYLEQLKELTDDWSKIIRDQFWGYDGYSLQPEAVDECLYEPFLNIISSYDEEKIQKALDSIMHPSKREYAFIHLLKSECEIDISAQDIVEDDLQSLEIGKHELVDNVNFFLKEGLMEDVILQILAFNAWILTESKLWLIEKFTDMFGENYVERMNTMIETDEFVAFNDTICSI